MLQFHLLSLSSYFSHVRVEHSLCATLLTNTTSWRKKNMLCLCFTALGLQQSQSTLVQENLPAKDIDQTCFKTFPIKATTCLQVGPMSLDWPVNPTARFDQSRPSSSLEDPNDEQQRGALPSHTPVGGRMLINHLKFYRVLQVEIHVATSLTEVCDVLLGTRRVSLGRLFLRRETRS